MREREGEIDTDRERERVRGVCGEMLMLAASPAHSSLRCQDDTRDEWRRAATAALSLPRRRRDKERERNRTQSHQQQLPHVSFN